MLIYFRMGQNLNLGVDYFRDVLIPETEVIIAAHLWSISKREADKILYPLLEKHVHWLNV